MSEQEGVIKYQLKHHHNFLAKNISITEINAWRHILLKMGFMGQDANRYTGFGFGNLSQQLNQQQFLITGSQTGHIKQLNHADYAQVLRAEPEKNSIESLGKTKPSSEALTHASVYQSNTNIHAVVHGHIPKLWKQTHQLNLAHTQANIPYGTPEMARAVTQLLETMNCPKQGIFSLLGHEDGIVCFSNTMEKAVTLLINTYIQAIMLE